MDGVICFDTVSQLKEIIPSLTEQRYVSMLPAVRENFNLAQNWCSMDDTLAKNLKEFIDA